MSYKGYKLPAWPFLLVVLLVVVATGMWLKDWENKGKVSYAEYIIPSGELRREFQELKIKEENAKLKHKVEQLEKEAKTPEPIRMAKLVYEYFSDDYITALAVFISESGLRPTAMGWNCEYVDETTGKLISKACAPQDRHLAWSVDCGITQLNISGQSCPEWTFNPRKNLEEARKKYNRRNWQPWVAHDSGKYEGNIAKALAYAKEAGLK